MHTRLKTFLREETLPQNPIISIVQQPAHPGLSLIVKVKTRQLSRKEQEACNRATD